MNYTTYWEYADSLQAELYRAINNGFYALADRIQGVLEQFPSLEGNLTQTELARFYRSLAQFEGSGYTDDYLFRLQLQDLKQRKRIERDKAFGFLLLAAFMGQYHSFLEKGKEINTQIAANKYEQLTGKPPIKDMVDTKYRLPMATGVTPSQAMGVEATYRAQQLHKSVVSNRAMGVANHTGEMVQLSKAKNALLKPTEKGWSGLCDVVMTNIIGYTVIQAAKDSGAEWYTFYGMLDGRQSQACYEACGGSDRGKQYRVSDMKLGVNVPPVLFVPSTGLPQPHPCRSWVVLDLSLLQSKQEYGIIGLISGGRNPESKEASQHAKTYYAFVRKATSDIDKIAANTGIDRGEIQAIKKHLFIEEHNLIDGKKQFDPDFMIAQSWQRLWDGKHIQIHDLTLLKHEEMERKLMRSGLDQDSAHIATSKIYNYTKEAKLFYGTLEKHRKD